MFEVVQDVGAIKRYKIQVTCRNLQGERKSAEYIHHKFFQTKGLKRRQHGSKPEDHCLGAEANLRWR